MPEDRRLAAIMFTDIVGYTALMGSDEDKAFKVLRKNREIQRPIIKKYRGEWLKEMGDGILASFHTASDAVRCAGEIQQAAKKEGIGLRIGIHEGEVVFEGGDVLGDGVNVASRLEELAEEGCINISGAVYKDIKNKAGITAEFMEEKTLKNVEEPVKVYKVHFEEQEVPATSSERPAKAKNKILYYIIAGLIVAITAILIWQFLPTKDTDSQTTEVTTEEVDKSIAVLPFRNDNPDQENEYFCNGMMEEILTNLQKIRDLHVKSRTSSEQYRNPAKDLVAIAKELEVAYILEGSVRKEGNNLRITAQLISGGTGDHLWAETYDGKYTEEIFKFQSDIATKIASALNAVITPKEKQKLATPPTINVTAYDYILQGRQEMWKYWLKMDMIALKKAENLFNEALNLDPEYALGWTMKASIYWTYYGNTKEYFKHNYLDSALWYCNKAIAIDPDVSNAYLIKGMVYHRRGNIKKAITNYEKTVEKASKQNDDIICREALWRLGYIYLYEKDYINGISLIQDAVEFAKGSPNDYSHLLHRLGFAYIFIGAYEVAEGYYIQSNNLRGMDIQICNFYNFQGNFQTSIDYASAYYKANSSDIDVVHLLANTYLQLRDYEKSLEYFREFRKNLERLGWIQRDNIYREGFVLVQLGYKEEGMELIEKQLAILDIKSNLQRADPYDYHYAAIYAFQGDYERALKHLRNYNKKELDMNGPVPLIPISYTQYDILFENLWDNKEFKIFIKEIHDEKAAIRAQVREKEERGELDL